jgi:hypothetical protein
MEDLQMHRRPSPLKIAGLALVALFAVAAPLAPLCHRAAAEEKVKKTELNSEMEDIDEAMKKLKRTLRKADQNAESLKLIAEVEQKMILGKSMTPLKTEKIPEADRAKFVAAYRKEMAGTIIDLLQMEQAVLDGDNSKAVEIWKSINDRSDKAHDQFMQKDEKKK